jgi:predicted RNase H-like nuclease (RuvC/YqgF family)
LPKERIGDYATIGLYEPFWPRNNYCYEISFVDSKQLERNNDERKRFFYAKDKITIKDNSYSEKIKELKNQTNLMPEEIEKWREWIGVFRQALAGENDKNSSVYKDGRKFIEDLENELNNKTSKNNNPERESIFTGNLELSVVV